MGSVPIYDKMLMGPVNELNSHAMSRRHLFGTGSLSSSALTFFLPVSGDVPLGLRGPVPFGA